MGNNINVILGSEGVCCLCSDVPHCGDCKKGDEPPPAPLCNCNDYKNEAGIPYYNSPICGGECDTACGEECQFAFPCPSVPEAVAQGCYECVSTCTCTSKGEDEPGTDCTAQGFDLSEEVLVSCGENCDEISCIHCACYTCTEYEYIDCGNPEKNCPSGKETPVPPAEGSPCPSGCCTCDPVPEEDCDCAKFGKFPFGTNCTEFGYDNAGSNSSEGPCVDEEGDPYNILCTSCKCSPCANNGWATSLDLCPDGKGSQVMPGATSDLCPVGCWECDEPPAGGCGVCNDYGPPCECCPSETGGGGCCPQGGAAVNGTCCCPQGEAPIPGLDGGPCVCVPD